jgi:hypothetical protein
MKKILGIGEDVITFGKYKNSTLSYILREDPSYIVWLYEETDTNIISEEIYDEACDYVDSFCDETDAPWEKWN